jgi:hypothetical protein
MMQHPEGSILGEAWGRKVSRERGEKSQKQKDVEIYQNLAIDATSRPELAEPFAAVSKDVERYVGSIDKHFYAKQAKNPEALQSSDEHRRRMHEALISSINSLSRTYRKEGMGNEWRRDIGEHRDRIRDWAVHVANFIEQKQKPEQD